MEDDSKLEGNIMLMSKEEAQKRIEFCKCVDRLKNNPDFKLFYDVYTRSELTRNAYMLTDVNITMSQSKKQLEENIMDTIKAISYFRNFVTIDIEQWRMLSEKALKDYRDKEAMEG